MALAAILLVWAARCAPGMAVSSDEQVGSKGSLEKEERPVPVGVGEEIPLFTLPALQPDPSGAARMINVRSYLDGAPESPRALLISFYALWCAPCQEEIVFLRELHARHGDRGLQILVVSIDKEEDAGKLRAQIFKDGALPFPVLRDSRAIVFSRFRLGALPAVYVVTADARARYFNDGFTLSMKQELEAEIQDLVAGGR